VAIIRAAEQQGLIGPGSIIVEPTSGQHRRGPGFMCAVRGYRLILTMPESMSMERRVLRAGSGPSCC